VDESADISAGGGVSFASGRVVEGSVEGGEKTSSAAGVLGLRESR
jgi:hypothetical protein